MTTYDRENIFAKILKGEIACKEIYADDAVLAFQDVSPAAPVHVLVIPKGEYVSFHDFTEKAGEDVVAKFFIKVREVANNLGLEKDGYRIIMNHGLNASQSVPHFHVHILGGKQLGGLISGDVLVR